MNTPARIIVYTTPYCPSCKSYLRMLLPACAEAKISVEVKNAMESQPDPPITQVPVTCIYNDKGESIQMSGLQKVQTVIDEYKTLNG